MKSLDGIENTNISTCLSCKKNIIIREEDDWPGNISEQLSFFHMGASNFEIAAK